MSGDDDKEYNAEWRERYTEEHHERAMDLLSEQESVQCVLGDYQNGQIVVHTPYVCSNVVTDICQQFGHRIVSFHPIWVQESEWSCFSHHGSTFLIAIQYDDSSTTTPIPMSTKFSRNYSEKLMKTDKQF